MKDDFCMLLALPSSDTKLMDTHQTSSLQSGFIDYLREKGAAGIINVPKPGEHEVAYLPSYNMTLRNIAFNCSSLITASIRGTRLLPMRVLYEETGGAAARSAANRQRSSPPHHHHCHCVSSCPIGSHLSCPYIASNTCGADSRNN